jgi:hypothetical protein
VAVQAYAYAFVSGQDRPKPDLWHWYRAVFANLAIVFTLGRQHSSAGSKFSGAIQLPSYRGCRRARALSGAELGWL